MTEIETLIREIYQEGFVVNLGVADAEGPWVAPVVYVFDDDLNLYWVSLPDARHSRAIKANGRVAATIVVSHETKHERALQVEGNAILLNDMLLEREQRLERKRGVAVPAKAGESLVKGHQWYKLMPTKIGLLHSEKFGYARQELTVS